MDRTVNKGFNKYREKSAEKLLSNNKTTFQKQFNHIERKYQVVLEVEESEIEKIYTGENQNTIISNIQIIDNSQQD